MISRLWRGWTTPQNADKYEQLLRGEILPGIVARNIPGFHGIQLLRRSLSDETEFVTIMWFDSEDAVRAFAGNDYERAVVPAAARQLLRRFEERSAHFELRAHRATD
jgi:heme-degrading monooxygenase HmoA